MVGLEGWLAVLVVFVGALMALVPVGACLVVVLVLWVVGGFVSVGLVVLCLVPELAVGLEPLQVPTGIPWFCGAFVSASSVEVAVAVCWASVRLLNNSITIIAILRKRFLLPPIFILFKLY